MIHRSALGRWLLIGAFVLWLFTVVSSFFAVQKPFSATNALAAADALLNLLTAGWLALIGLALGAWLLRALLGHNLPLAETLVLGTALGLGALGLLSFGLGLLRFFRPTVAWPVTLALSGLAIPPVIRLVRQWRGWRPSNLPHRWIALYLGAVALLALGRQGFRLTLQAINPADEQEDHKGHDDKIQHCVEEQAVVDRGCPSGLRLLQ